MLGKERERLWQRPYCIICSNKCKLIDHYLQRCQDCFDKLNFQKIHQISAANHHARKRFIKFSRQSHQAHKIFKLKKLLSSLYFKQKIHQTRAKLLWAKILRLKQSCNCYFISYKNPTNWGKHQSHKLKTSSFYWY